MISQIQSWSLWLMIALVAASLWLSACSSQVAQAGKLEVDLSGRPIQVVATTGQVGDLVRNVGGERVIVTTLMGPGVDPHLYKASARDVITIDRADVLFYNGLHLEGRMVEIFERLAHLKPVYAVADAIPREHLRQAPEFQGSCDPHVWFDPTLWMFAADGVAKQLGKLDPDHADLYEANAARYKQALAELDTYAQERLSEIPSQSRVLITAHDAFGYFGQRYGLEVRGLQGISTASEAGAADVQQLAAFIADRDIRAIFIETSVPQATINAVEAAVRARGKEVMTGGQLFSDALGAADTPAGTYIGMFRHNVDTIARALAPAS
jgi:manganese/zinc/iron transport system substrate-binding protein